MRLVFVHGFLGSAMNWGPILSKVRAMPDANGWELLTPELLAHGRRGQESFPRPLTLDPVAEDLERQLPPGTFTAIGHSFGVRPLLKFTAKFPGRISRLIVEDSSPVISGPGYRQLISIFDEIRVPFSSREEAKAALDAAFGLGTPMSKFLLSNIRETSPSQHDWRFHRAALRELLVESKSHELWDEWTSFEGPIHMILGANSHYVPEERLAECVSTRVGKLTQIVKIPGAGHWVHSDRPAEFVSEVIRIIKEDA